MSEWNVGAPPFRWGFCLVSWKGRATGGDNKHNRHKKSSSEPEEEEELLGKLLRAKEKVVARKLCLSSSV